MKKEITYKKPKSILTATGGYLEGYTHSLNPYIGCVFGCSYCYVRQMPVSLFRGKEWGAWLDVKTDVKELFRKELIKAKKKGPVTIFMSSSTDPYQPIEHKEEVTRSLLEIMSEEPPDFLFVQTRSPLVTRDIDLFIKLKDRIRVSVTIETDLEDIRKTFSQAAPPIPARMKALATLSEAGLPTQATIAPVLPSSTEFPEKLKTITNRICVDDFYMGDGSGGKRTKRLGIEQLYKELDLQEWYQPYAYLKVLKRLKGSFSDAQIFISQEGFLPN